MRKKPLTWQIETTEKYIRVQLNGGLNEDFPFKDLIAELKGKETLTLQLDLSQIQRINSMGIREWFNFLRALAWPSTIILSECSTIFTQALSQIKELAHKCFVTSCHLSVWCSSCEDDFDARIELNQNLLDQKVEFPCPRCGQVCAAEMWGIEDIVKKQANHNAI